MNTRPFIINAATFLAFSFGGAALACQCEDAEVFIHFEDAKCGQSVVGMGTVHRNLNIETIHFTDNARVIETGKGVKGSCDPGVPGPCMPFAFGAPNNKLVANNCLEDEYGQRVELMSMWPPAGTPTAKGFADVENFNTDTPQEFKFTFGELEHPDDPDHRYKVESFEILVVDFGDFNTGPDYHGDPNSDPRTHHRYGLYGFADPTADHHDTNWVDSDVVAYNTPPDMHPRSSTQPSYGDLWYNGDACSVNDAFNNFPGHHHLKVQSEEGLGVVYLMGWEGADPHGGFDSIRFKLICDHDKGCPLNNPDK